MIRSGSRQRHLADWSAQAVLQQTFVVRWILPQALALTAAAMIVAQGPQLTAYADGRIWALLAGSFAVLRVAAVRTQLVPSTFALDAIGSAVFIGGTGAADSPFFALAVAGAWWASMKDRRGSLYALAFGIGYVLLVAPPALRVGDIGSVLYQPAFVSAVGVMADRLTDANRGRWAFTVLHRSVEQGPDSVKVGLSRALRGGSVPIDVLLTAGQLGLTAIQTELIAYLILGLSNQEIADALSVSEATVRYRLTRLYRVLDVRGRKAAAERARELGLDALVAGTGADADAAPPQNAPK